MHAVFNPIDIANIQKPMLVVTERGHEEEVQEDQDQDSLFGSPPPSPRPAQAVGIRQPSPALALPRAGVSVSAATNIQKNVGTIALPGSQLDSELPINPLALSLNHGVGMVHRPPALPDSQAAYTYGGLNPTTTARRPTVSRQAGASTGKKKRSRVSSSSRDGERTASPAPAPHPLPLEFTLPDPSAPPPTHFLRNQENLLGRAGRVAGVKPSTLTTQPPPPSRSQNTHTRGTTPSNPILVDTDDTPTIGLRRPHPHTSSSSRSRESSQPLIDPAKLTPPSNEEIVSVLIGQKDIFPVLESILKLIVKGAKPLLVQPEPRMTGFERRKGVVQRQSQSQSQSTTTTESSTPSSTRSTASPTPTATTTTTTTTSSTTPPLHAPPPVKKRKLNRVPAGASDWDVPFPFAAGEGPAAYTQNWERDRGKRLIEELIKLIKVAARKAANKKYLEGEERRRSESGRVNGYYRPETAMYGLGIGVSKGQQEVLKDTSNAEHFRNEVVQTEMHGSSSSSSAAAPFGNATSNDLTSFEGFDDLFVDPSFQSQPLPPLNGADQNMFDTWMSFLEAFPVAFDSGACSSTSTSATGSTSCASSEFSFSGASTPTPTPSTTMSSLRLTPSLDFDTPIGFGALPLRGIEVGEDQTGAELDTMFNEMMGWASGGLAVSPSVPMDPTAAESFDFGSITDFPPPAVGNQHIDPTLWPLSLAQPNMALGMDVNAMGMLNVDNTARNQNQNQNAYASASSPVASSSSFGGSQDPLTPASAGWEVSMPDVFGVGVGVDGQGRGFEEFQRFAAALGEEASMNLDASTTRVDKGKGRAVEAPIPVSLLSRPPPSLLDTLAETAFHAQQGMKTSEELFRSVSASTNAAPPSTSASTSTAPMPTLTATATKPRARPRARRGGLTTSSAADRAARQSRKEDILKRARARRQQVQEELDEVRKRLWETTVEQAALVHLVRKMDEVAVIDAEGRRS